ncbi:replication initiator [Enemella evansiae]|uniref:replication initiator n=1 Tax=Enemella evansiae TaxID=2016499 RepID=UPI002B4BF4EF|nr:replication initiator [Enemella evansiae]
MARDLAAAHRVCVRPIIRRVLDRDTGESQRIPVPCGATRETVCPPCAQKARALRMQQCAEGWHRAHEPDITTAESSEDSPPAQETRDDEDGFEQAGGGRRVRSTRRRTDAASLPKRPAEDRTVGRVFTTPDGRAYRPSMFLTLTLGSYGRVRGGLPVDPGGYDYRRAALDALHFPKLVDRFWQNLRRCAGFKVQYFASIEPQSRLAPHLHAAVRGAVPRRVLRQVIGATYVQVWWPPCDTVVYPDDRLPVWDGTDYVDPATGAVLPSWADALDATLADEAAEPVHVMRFGTQADMRGIIAPSDEADRAVRYLTKYLTKAISDPLDRDPDHDDDGDQGDPGREAHIARLVAELRYLPCSPRCANWLRYGVQPQHARADQFPGRCRGKAHDREHLGLGGRRVLVSRQWSGKTLGDHKADRATVVREALLAAGVVAPETERLAATVLSGDGLPRFVWISEHPDPTEYVAVIFASIAEKIRWRTQYELAKQAGNVSATAAQPP